MPGRVISLLGGAGGAEDHVVMAYWGFRGVVSVRERRGRGVCRGNDRVFFVSGFQDLRGNARGGRVLSASGRAHQGTTWREKSMFL